MVNFILVDQEFNKFVDQKDMAVVNTTAAREHSTDAKRGICTIENTPCCTVAKLRCIEMGYLSTQAGNYTPGILCSVLDKFSPSKKLDMPSFLPQKNCDQTGGRLQVPL